MVTPSAEDDRLDIDKDRPCAKIADPSVALRENLPQAICSLDDAHRMSAALGLHPVPQVYIRGASHGRGENGTASEPRLTQSLMVFGHNAPLLHAPAPATP